MILKDKLKRLRELGYHVIKCDMPNLCSWGHAVGSKNDPCYKPAVWAINGSEYCEDHVEAVANIILNVVEFEEID